ncbi:MAG: CPBP family intramembrane metalloprotease [Propionibacteriaceae bacterium]|nr:CPBP family intramembrane metalloprotease [Propionibacteriaceae bacterium]
MEGLRDPEAGLSYPDMLRMPGEPVGRQAMAGLIGTMLAIVSYFVVVPLVTDAGNWLVWLVTDRVSDFTAFDLAAKSMQTPAGMFVRHLALACVILIAALVVAVFHRVRPRWLNSVQPGFRWRYAFICFAVSLVVMNLVLWAENGFQIGTINPQPDFGWFLLVIFVTTPFQAAAEEYLFRGYLLQSLTMIARNKWAGVVVSAAIFAFFHANGDLLIFGYRFGFGLLAGSLVVLTGGLEAAIAAHVVNNLCSFTYAALSTSVASAIAVIQITWVELVLPLAGFAICGALAVLIGRKLQVAVVTP